MSVATLFAAVESERNYVRMLRRMFWTALTVCAISWASFFSFTALAIWSSLNHVDARAACWALGAPGLVFGLITLVGSVVAGVSVNCARADLLEAEAKYNDALVRENNL